MEKRSSCIQGEMFYMNIEEDKRVKDDEYFRRLFELNLSKSTPRYLYIVISSNSSECALNFTILSHLSR